LTFKDATELTRLIGEDYIWIDALCIMQDDVEERTNTLQAMHRIYEEAVMIIVAASGENADAGLPGLISWFSKH
jgi:hypothetical protein